MDTCFVVMGFGKKTDFESGRTLDLDKTYHNVIKPAVTSLGIECIRADEIVHSGLIDVPMYEHLLGAELVIADLSTANRNAFYELGVRHALRPHATIVIAEDGIKPPFPFDINHLVIRQYHHMGEDIGYSEVMAFRQRLTDAIREIMPLKKTDSPVHEFLKGLSVTRPDATSANVGVTAAPREAEPARTHSDVIKQVDVAQAAKNFGETRRLLESILADMERSGEPDPYIVQRLALVTYKSKEPSEGEALQKARTILERLAPRTSNDTETLGLWGAVHKRLWEVSANRADLDEAVRSYERGFYIRNDYYNGINLAYLLNLRATLSAPAEAIADFVTARRVRREVLEVCESWLRENRPPGDDATVKAMKEYLAARYWVVATRAEALLGLDDPAAGDVYTEAFALDVPDWMRDSTREQRGKLEPMLADSPLKHVVAGSGRPPS